MVTFANAYYDSIQGQPAPTTEQLQGNFGEPVVVGGTGNADQLWNQGWNSGFNNPSTGYSGNDVNERAGYVTGQQEYWKRNPGTVAGTSNTNPTGTPVTSTPTNNDNPTNNNNPTGTEVNVPSGPSAEEIRQQELAMINQQYGENEGLINQQEQNLRDAFPGQQKEIEDSYGLAQKRAGNTYDSTLQNLMGQEVKTKQGQEQMMDQARRLFNELLIGSQQRFGGSSSAGEGAKAILGSELQRTMGANKQTAFNQLAEINQKRTDFTKEYEFGLQQLETEKASALRELDYKFKDQLYVIQADRTKNQQMKQREEMQSLKDYASELSNVRAKAIELQNSLALQRDKMETQFQYELGLINARAATSSQYSEPAWKVSQYEDTPFFYNSKGQTQSIDPNSVGVINNEDEEEKGFLDFLK